MARPACAGDSPYLSWLGERVVRTTAATRGVIRPNASALWSLKASQQGYRASPDGRAERRVLAGRNARAHEGAQGFPAPADASVTALMLSIIDGMRFILPAGTVEGGNSMTSVLAEKTCTPCRGGTPPLSVEEAEAYREQAPE